MKKLDIIVREYMNSIGASQVDNRYARFLQFAIECVKEINREYKTAPIKVKRIPVSEVNFTAALPLDYVDYLKIAVCYRGQMFALGLNDNMCPPHFDECGNIVVDGIDDPNRDYAVGNSWSWGNRYNSDGFYIGKMYGLGGGGNSIGSYNVYKSQGYIAFQNFSGDYDEIILQYLGDIEDIDGEHVVDSAFSEAIKSWIYWKSIQRMRSYGLGEKKDAEQTYYNEKRKGAMNAKAFTLLEAVSAIRQGYKSSPKI